MLENDFSSKDKLSLEWLNYLIIAITIVLLLYFILFILIFHNINKVISSKIFFIILSFFIYFFGYKGLRQKQVIIDNEIQKIKYAKSSLSKEFSVFWKEKLLKFLEDEKPFLDPELSLSKLALNLGLSENNLSQIINSELDTTFYDLINNYRIEEVKQILLSGKEINILESALKAGFNSKTTFNTLFKRKTGLTPTQFLINQK
jgi:AraC-like DNA-binding protein